MTTYGELSTEFYDLDKPSPPSEALAFYQRRAQEINRPVLEPMCGSGRFLVPLAQAGIDVDGFDLSTVMLNRCRQKYRESNINPELFHASFDDVELNRSYGLIFIPSGSFNLLVDDATIRRALKRMYEWLDSDGALVFEVETLQSAEEHQHNIWTPKWVDRADGTKIVLSTTSRFDSSSRINTTLCRYELWNENSITQTEVEIINLRLYGVAELDSWLEDAGLSVVKKTQPYSGALSGDEEVVVYECEKR